METDETLRGKIDEFTNQIEDDPHDPWLHGDRGAASISLYRRTYDRNLLLSALQDLTRAIELDDQEPWFYLDRAEASTSLGYTDTPFEDLNRAIKLDPTSAYAYYRRGIYLSGRYDNQSAMVDLYRAVQLDPEEPHYRLRRGHSFLEDGQAGRAVLDYDEAIRLNNEVSGFYFSRAYANLYHVKIGDFSAAIHDLEKAISLDEASPGRYERGLMRFFQKDWDGAVEDFEARTRQIFEDDHHFLWLYLARVSRGEWQVALRELQGKLDGDRKRWKEHRHIIELDASCHWPWPVLRYFAGEIGAIELEQESRNTNPPIDDLATQAAEYHFYSGQLLLAQGDKSSALWHLGKVGELLDQTSPYGRLHPRSWLTLKIYLNNA